MSSNKPSDEKRTNGNRYDPAEQMDDNPDLLRWRADLLMDEMMLGAIDVSAADSEMPAPAAGSDPFETPRVERPELGNSSASGINGDGVYKDSDAADTLGEGATPTEQGTEFGSSSFDIASAWKNFGFSNWELDWESGGEDPASNSDAEVQDNAQRDARIPDSGSEPASSTDQPAAGSSDSNSDDDSTNYVSRPRTAYDTDSEDTLGTGHGANGTAHSNGISEENHWQTGDRIEQGRDLSVDSRGSLPSQKPIDAAHPSESLNGDGHVNDDGLPSEDASRASGYPSGLKSDRVGPASVPSVPNTEPKDALALQRERNERAERLFYAEQRYGTSFQGSATESSRRDRTSDGDLTNRWVSGPSTGETDSEGGSASSLSSNQTDVAGSMPPSRPTGSAGEPPGSGQYVNTMSVMPSGKKRSTLLPRMSSLDVDALHKEIRDLHDEIGRILPVGHETAERARHLLEKAYSILDSDPMRSAEVEYYMQQVRAIVQRIRQTHRWSNLYRDRLRVYLVGWALLSGVVLASRLVFPVEFDALLGAITGMSVQSAWFAHLSMAVVAMFAGALGGAAGALYTMSQHAQKEYGFFDRKYGLRGLILPIMGLIVGTLIYVVFGLFFQLIRLDPSQAPLLASLPALLAFIFGIAQESIYGTRS